MKNHSLPILLMAAAAATASGAAGAASFAYGGLNYTDAACTTGFTMDANGTISCSTAATTPPATATAAPVCNVTQNPAFAQNGAATTILSNCSASPNNPTSYSWTLTPLTPTAGNTSTVSTTQNYTPSTSLTPGTYTVALTASNTIGPATGTLSTTLTVNAPVASSDQCAAQGLTRKTDVTVMNWGSGMRKDGLKLGANEAYVLSFTAPASMTSAYSSIYTLYSGTTKLITISSDACGFNTPLNGSAACSLQQDPQMMTDEAGPTYSERTTTPYCKLTPGQTYYVNIRNAKPNVSPVQNSCTSSAGCTFSLSY
ncbi:MAG: hypothetical protein PHZ14_08350 [Sulfuricella sp.]|jgi:hypothetical protein|nr:hypothetical protein [Sulfuricella sp.]